MASEADGPKVQANTVLVVLPVVVRSVQGAPRCWAYL